MTSVNVTLRTDATRRTDTWWVPPLVTAVVLSAFVVYGTWAAFVNADYYTDPYLSPFYSPCLAANCEHTTCYYYRKAYYRAFLWSPPACAVKDARPRYSGEARFPAVLQNLHRYFFYLTLPFPIILFWDGLRAFDFPDGFGMGLGTVILLVNAVLLAAYTLSCHSCRHLCGGHVDVFSGSPRRYRLWRFVSSLNARHMPIAWVSLAGVALTDLYVRLVATGVISDPRFF
jgi:hypothetical protein